MGKDKKDKVKDLQNEVGARAREIWLAGLGALSTVEEEGTKVFKKLVEKGEGFEKKGKAQIDDLLSEVSDGYKKIEKKLSDKFNKAEDELEASVAKVVKGLGVPTSDEVSNLTNKVEKLTKQVEALANKLATDPAAKAPVEKAPATKKTAN